jgi:hypothetical protein
VKMIALKTKIMRLQHDNFPYDLRKNRCFDYELRNFIRQAKCRNEESGGKGDFLC